MWDRFLRACRGQAVDVTPVWFMRQAGRYMAEYRALRAKHTLLEICAEPELAAQVTLQPVEAHRVDAAILFADILLPLAPMGASFEFAKGEGPVIHHPIQTASDVRRLSVFDIEQELDNVMEAIRLSKRELSGKTPLIGFAGAPFTLASYLVEGGKSSGYLATKSLMYSDSVTWHALLEKLSEVVTRYLVAQVRAGADAVQLFDSWVGALAPNDYRELVLPHVRRILASVADLGVPVIHFGTATGSLLELMKEAGGSVMGVDWRVPLDRARQRLGSDMVLQGNLDPAVLLAPADVLERRIADVLQQASAPHVFNLGHGILPSTPPENVSLAVELVHRLSRK